MLHPNNVNGVDTLVDLFLFVHAQLSGAHIDQEEQAAPIRQRQEWFLRWPKLILNVYLHDRQYLEKVVLGEIFVRMIVMKLNSMLANTMGASNQSRCWKPSSTTTECAYRPEIVDK